MFGGGSNIVFMCDFDGVVLFDEIVGCCILCEDDDVWYVEVGGGENWYVFVVWMFEYGMLGFENFVLILGIVGVVLI